MNHATIMAVLALSLTFPAGAQEPTSPAPAPAPAIDPSQAQGAPAAESAPVAAAQPAPAPRASGAPIRLELKSGQIITGRVLSRDASSVTVETEDGIRTTVPTSAVAREEVAGVTRRAPFKADPNRARYLYSPSGFMLEEGRWTFSQTELIVSSLSYGVTDWLTLNIGGSIPFWFVGDGFNLIGGAKVGGSIGEYVHVAGSAQALAIPSLTTSAVVGLAFGTVTVGTPGLHLGVSAGAPFAASADRSEFGDYAVSVSGSWRVSRGIGIVTENWFFPNADGLEPVRSLGVRFIGDRLAVDTAFIFISGSPIPIPWLDFTYHFGGE